MGLKIGVGNTNPTFGYDSYYGVRFNLSSSSTDGTRVGKSTLHQSLPIQSQMRDCIVADNGQVVAYLDPNDRTKLQSGGDAVLDGSWGQVMCEIPAHYRKFEFTDTTWSVLISEHALPGFHYVPKSYIGAYKATVDRTVSATKKLCSVKNATANFRGGNGSNSSWDELSKTLLQRPCSNESLDTYRIYAANRGAGWYQHLWDVKKAVWWLFVVEYATLNTQKPYNAALDANGYHQGGLGDGVTTLNSTKWNSFNGYHPFTPIGTTDSLGNRTGVVSYTMPEEYDSTTTTVSVPAYRGIENPFGEIWEWVDGVCLDIQSNNDGGKSLVYTCNDLSALNFDSNLNGYTLKGSAARTEGYVKKMIMGEQGEIIPSEVGGSSSTYFADYFYTSLPSSGVSRRAVYVGGSAYYGAYAGLVFVLTHYGSSFTNAHIGARLCYIP